MMKTYLIALVGLIFGVISCKKDSDPADDANILTTDYRDAVTGDYSGVETFTYWYDSVVGMHTDTLKEIIMTLSKSEEDSIVILSFTPHSFSDFAFKLADGQFSAVISFHPPTLILTDDSLYFKHRPGMGFAWYECFAKRVP